MARGIERTQFLGADIFQAYLLKIGEDNPLGIYEGHFWLAIAGWRVPCYNEFIEEWDAGLIVKGSGTHPDPSVEVKPRQQDLGKYTDTSDTTRGRKGCQPWLVQFPIKHAKYWMGIPELAAAMRHTWQSGQNSI